jgi:hypothetical protein
MKATVKAAKERALAFGAEWIDIPLKQGTQPGRRKATGAGGNGKFKR